VRCAVVRSGGSSTDARNWRRNHGGLDSTIIRHLRIYVPPLALQETFAAVVIFRSVFRTSNAEKARWVKGFRVLISQLIWERPGIRTEVALKF
jgi:hypothetical protein